MILPSLISLSVAPGSYFFCARADVVANTAAASMARAASLLRQPGIVLSPVFCSLVLLGVSQGGSRLASAAIFREVKRRLWNYVPRRSRFRTRPSITSNALPITIAPAISRIEIGSPPTHPPPKKGGGGENTPPPHTN